MISIRKKVSLKVRVLIIKQYITSTSDVEKPREKQRFLKDIRIKIYER